VSLFNPNNYHLPHLLRRQTSSLQGTEPTARPDCQ
jgi:hypothetical protein